MSLDWIAANRAQLARSGVLRQVLRSALIDHALAEAVIPMPPSEELEALQQRFWQQQQLPPPQRPAWLAQRQLQAADLAAIVSRPLRWKQWCCQQWSPKLEALFLKHKNQLDVACASLLRLEDPDLAREFYLRLQEGEADFEELARQYCGDDQPQRQAGRWGPKPLSGLPPALAELLRCSPVRQLRPPQRLGHHDWVVLRVESFIGSRLDDPGMAERLLQLEGEAWLEQACQRWLARQAPGRTD